MFTFYDLLTATGAAAVAATVLLFVELLKKVIPSIFEKVNGAFMAFIFTFIIYIIGAFVVANNPPPDTSVDANYYLQYFLGWLACAATAVGIKSVATYGLTGSNAVGPG